MTALRYFNYAISGTALTALWIFWGVYSFSSATATPTLILFPVIAVILAIAFDRWVHRLWHGQRVIVRWDRYVPCPVCPFTNQPANRSRSYVHQSFVGALIETRLPILISREADEALAAGDIDNIPGFKISRVTPEHVVLHLKDRTYHDAFLAAQNTESPAMSAAPASVEEGHRNDEASTLPPANDHGYSPRKRGLKQMAFGGIVFAGAVVLVNWVLPRWNLRLEIGGLFGFAAIGAWFLVGLVQVVTNKPFHYWGQKWMQLKGWQRGILGTAILVVATVVIVGLMALYLAFY
ncbi:MAG: hypothetical protein ABIO94_13055 [Opitutaceae bacterium]